MSDNENRVLNFNISQYFDRYYKKCESAKIAIYITAKQVAYMIGNEYMHFEKVVALSKAIFPERNYGYEDFYEGAISIYSSGDYLTIHIPDVVDPIQYECFKELLEDVLAYEEEEQVRILDEDANKYLSEAREKLGHNIEEDEVIMENPYPYELPGLETELVIGRPHNIRNLNVEEGARLGG